MKKPNILFLFPDQHRSDWLPYDEATRAKMGYDSLSLQMRNLRKLMMEGATFTEAVTSSPLCAPARACLAAGLRYQRCQVPNNSVNYPVSQRSFYGVLRDGGYSVGGVGKFDLHKANSWWGLDGWVDEFGAIGFTHGIDNAGKWDAISSYSEHGEPRDPYMGFLAEHSLLQDHIADMEQRKHTQRTEPTTLPEEAYCDNWLTNNGVRLLQDFPVDKPWFLQVNFTGPHDPWDVTREMRQTWEKAQFPSGVQWNGDKVILNAVRQNYAAMLENIDRNIGRLIGEIDRRGELENTVIIYSSDHGEMLGDFGTFGKSRPERGSVNVPLVVWGGKDIRAGMVSHALVELQDLTATILDYCGLQMPEAKDSQSLRPILSGQATTHRTYQVSALENWRTIADEQYKLMVVQGQDHTREMRLYRKTDLWEQKNIAQDNPEVVQRLLQLAEQS